MVKICRFGSSILVLVIGIVCIVLGTMFIIQANSNRQEIANEIQPLKIEQVDAKYEVVKASQIAYATAEEPKIQAGQADPSAMYSYLSAQRALLGLAKSNLGVVDFVRMSGMVTIIIGASLLIISGVMFKGSLYKA